MTDGTFFRTVTIDEPDFGAAVVTFALVSSVAIADNQEIFPRREYAVTLDADGLGSITLPCADDTGTRAWLWSVTLNGTQFFVMAYGASISLAELLVTSAATEDPASLTALLNAKMDKQTAATAGNAGEFDANGQVVDAGFAFGTAAASDTSDFDPAGSATAAIAALGGTDATVSDEQLRNWAGQMPQLMTAVTRTDYSDGLEFGWIQVTGTVTWPDGVTGHIDGVEYPDDLGRLQYFTASHVASGKLVIQAPLADGVAGITVITPDYFVDGGAGAGGDGSLATPFDALADLSGLQSGDVVAIKSGHTYTETLTAVAGVSYYRYGAGAKPLIDAGQTLAGTWIQDGTYTSTWYQDVTVELHPSTSYVQLVADGLMPTRAASVAALDALPGQFYATPDTGSGDTTVRIHINPDGADPNASGVVYRCPRRVFSISGLSADGCTFDGVVAQLGSHNSQSQLGDTTTVRNCEFLYGNDHNLLVGENCIVKALVCKFAKWGPGGIVMVCYVDVATGGNLDMDSAYFYLPAYDSAMDGFYAHRGASGTLGTITVSRAKFENVDAAFDGLHCAALVLNNSIANSCREATIANVPLTVDGLSVLASATTPAATRIGTINTATTATWNRVYADMSASVATATTTVLFQTTQAATMTVTNCQLKSDAGRGILINNAAAILNHFGNNYLGTGWSQRLYTTNIAALNSNRNVFDNEDGNFVNYLGTTYTTLAAWQAVIGQDSVSSIGGAVGDKLP